MKKIIVSFVLLVLVSLPSVIFAANLSNAFGNESGNALKKTSESAGLKTDSTDLLGFIQKVITALLSLLGVIFMILIFYGGYLWLTDMGSEDQVKKAKKIISTSIWGLIIIVAAYGISALVVSKLADSTLQK